MQLSENEWSLIPNTALAPVLPTAAEMGAAWCSATKSCPGQVMAVWVSLTYDYDTGDLLLVHAGGHGDCGGHGTYRTNALRALMAWLSGEPISGWHRAEPPLQLDGPTNPDGKCPRPAYGPPGIHSYDGAPYIGDGRMLLLGGLGYCRGSNMIPGVQAWVGNIHSDPFEWEQVPHLEPFAKYATTAVDENHIYILNDSRDAAILNRETLAIEQSWINNHPLDLLSGFGAMGLSADGYLCVADGSYLSVMHRDTFGVVVKRPIRNKAPFGSLQADLGTAMAMVPLPDGRMVLWNGGDIFTFKPGEGNDPALDVWERFTKPAVAPNNALAVGGDDGRTYSKLFYMPETGLLVACVNTTEGLWLYRVPGLALPDEANFEARSEGAVFAQGFNQPIGSSRDLRAPEAVALNGEQIGNPTAVMPRVVDGAVRFEIKSGQAGAGAGQYYADFPPIAATDPIFVQWRQFIPKSLLHTGFKHTNGRDLTSPKLLIIAAPGRSSCTANHIVVVKDNWSGPFDSLGPDVRGGLALYHACGYYDQVTRPGPIIQGVTQFDTQPVIPEDEIESVLAAMIAGKRIKPAGPSSGRRCWHTGRDRSGAVELVPDKWATYQVAREILGNPYQIGSGLFWPARLRLWQQVDGGENVLVIDSLLAMRAQDRGYGRVWFLPYMTNKDPTQVHPDTYTLVDEVIVSRQRISDRS